MPKTVPVRAAMNELKLVYPPVSNQVGDWLWEDKSVRDYLKSSQIYMLGHRQELFLRDYKIDNEKKIITFDLVCGETVANNLYLSIDELRCGFNEEIEVAMGKDHIKILDVRRLKGEPIYWATTDKLLYDYWRNRITIHGLDDVTPFTIYKLHYIGISKENDSFTRLWLDGHKNRLKVLTNERQIAPEARLTDEIMVFFFDIESTIFKELTVEEPNQPENLNKKNLIADVEKAFIHVLDTPYNREKYRSFPKSTDGLYKEKLDFYTYSIFEDITFETPTATFVGVHPKNKFGRTANLIRVVGSGIELLLDDDSST